MAKSTKHYFCEFSQGTARCSGWIEERGAKVGNRVEILTPGMDGLWDVISVGDKPTDKTTLRFREGANKFASIS